MATVTVERRRSGGDVIFGILLFIGGLIVLGDVVVASVVSVLFIGWLTLISGIVGIIGSLFKIGKGGGFWSTLLSGAVLAALGILILRNPHVTLIAITFMLGFGFLVSGLVRVVGVVEASSTRWVLFVSGLISIALGLIVLFNLNTQSLILLGVLIGIQMLVDGMTLLLYGRARVTVTEGA